MKKIIIIVTLLALSIGTFSCGGGSGSSSSPRGENPGLPSVVQLRSSHNVAQTNATVYLHARILDGNGVPVKYEPVTFTNLSEPFGVIKTVLRVLGLRKPVGALSAPVVKTNNLGIATVKLTSTTSGFATIQAEVNGGAGQVRDRRTIFFGEISGPVAAPPPTMSLHVDDGNGTFDQNDDFNLFKGGSAADNQRTIKAVVLNGSGVPLQGVTVTFGSDSPDEVTFTPSPPIATTNANGEAYVVITVKPAILNLQRVLNITAQADLDGDDKIDVADVVSLFLQPVTVTSVTVTANPDRVAPGGTSTILASVKMLQSLPVPDGSSVSFETTCGTVTPFGLTTDGVATATFTAPSVPPPSGACTVTASIGGVSGTASITISTSLTVQPPTQTMNGVAGGTATFTIFGGVAPYTVTSNDTAFPPSTPTVAASGGTFSVTVPANSTARTVTFTVRDSIGTSVTATLTIAGSSTSLAVLPSAVTADSAAPEDTILFTIFGGVPPYSVFSNNPAVFPPSTPTVAASGGTFSVTVPVDAPGGSVIMTIRDSGSPAATATATITIAAVTPQPLIVVPATRSIGNPEVGNNVSFTIFGGKAPYKAYSEIPLLVTVPEDAAANTVTATVAVKPTTDTTVTITIVDSLGESVEASLILDVAPIASLAVIPSAQTITNPLAGDPVRGFAEYTVIGGTLTGYQAFSSNPTLVTTPMVGNVVRATVQPGVTSLTADTTVTISIIDSAANTTSATLTLDVSPAQVLTVLPDTRSISGVGGGAATFTIYGGTPGYTVTSGNPAKAYDSGAGDGNWSVALSGDSFTVNVPANIVAEDITLTVSDQAGATKTATLKITAGPTLSVQPGAQTISGITGGPLTFTVAGGIQGYIVTSSNPAIAYDSAPGDGIWNVASSGDSFVVNVPANSPSGSVTLTVRDSGGSSPVSATLTIAEPTITLSLTPDTFDIGTAAGGTVDIQYFVSGGAAPYQVFFTLPVFIDAWSPTHNGWWVGTAGDNDQEFTVRYAWSLGTTAKFQMIVVDSLGETVDSEINMEP